MEFWPAVALRRTTTEQQGTCRSLRYLFISVLIESSSLHVRRANGDLKSWNNENSFFKLFTRKFVCLSIFSHFSKERSGANTQKIKFFQNEVRFKLNRKWFSTTHNCFYYPVASCKPCSCSCASHLSLNSFLRTTSLMVQSTPRFTNIWMWNIQMSPFSRNAWPITFATTILPTTYLSRRS